MARFIKTTVFTGVPFGLLMGLFFGFKYGILPGIISGVAAGLFFGLALAAFLAWQQSRFTPPAGDLEGEQVLKHGPANHFRGMESLGGWLYLTDTRLLFRAHGFNVQHYELSLPLTEIAEAQTCMTLWVIPNGLRVLTDQGAERFIVEGRRSWVEAIESAKG